MDWLLAIIFGYGLGSIPFGLVLCQLAGLGDIRNIGSGGIGATNVLRTGNKFLAALTLILDSGKGAIAALITLFFVNPDFSLLSGLFAIIGHCYPVWLKFKGGKGVATAFGTLLVTVPLAGLIGAAIWLVTAFLSRISSLSALIASLLVPFAVLFLYGTHAGFLTAIMSILIFWKHKANIKRLLKGEEPKIALKKKAQQ